MTPIPGSLCDREQDKFIEDAAGKTAVNITACAPIPVTLSGATAGTKIHLSGNDVTDGTSQTLISTTVGVGKTLSLSKVSFSTTIDGKGTIEIAGSVVGTVRTNGATQNPSFVWDPTKAATAGQLVEVKFISFQPRATDIEAYLMATEV